MVVRYNSVVELAEKVSSIPYKPEIEMKSGDNSWCGGHTVKTAKTTLVNGDSKYVPRANALIDKINVEVTTPHNEWVPSVYGAYPVVPEFLAGSPTPMRVQRALEGEYAPISIYVGVGASSVTAEQIANRGAAILALVMKLQEFRPVDLWILGEDVGQTDGEYLQLTRVETRPLDISIAAFMICDVGFERRIMQYVAASTDGMGQVAWPRDYVGSQHDGIWERHIRQVLNMQPQDMYIPAAYLTDTKIFTQPIEWVRGIIEGYVNQGD